MYEVELPYDLTRRREVRPLLAAQGVPEDLTGEQLVVHCASLLGDETGIIDELVKIALRERNAAEVALVGAPPEVREAAWRAGWRRGYIGRVNERDYAEVGD